MELLEEEKKAIEQQLKSMEDNDNTQWSKVGSDIELVNGPSHPLSNMYEHRLHAFGHDFIALEHAYHYKKGHGQKPLPGSIGY